MKILNICIVFSANITGISENQNYEQQYNVLKKILQFLYVRPKCRVAFSFPGELLSWTEKKHPEFIKVLSELIARKQTELLGGGYYNPVFPLIFPVDRSGQIELMTSEIRRMTGKRPRGMSLVNSAWDSSLISCLHNGGMEYVMMDSSLVPKQREFYLPQILSEQGKSVKLLPVYRKFLPDVINEISPEAYLSKIIKKISKHTEDDIYDGKTEKRVISLEINTETAEHLLNSSWLENFFEAVNSTFENKVTVTTPSQFIADSYVFVPSYIPAGIREDIARWSLKPYCAAENVSAGITVNDFLLTYPRNRALFNRMQYISMLISQCHGDKARKKSARESLWKAQRGDAYLCTPDGIFANNVIRQNAYRNLTEAEKFLREATDSFTESITSFDYDNDGCSEYICRMEKFTACITPVCGQINELNIMHNTGNYADNMVRIEKFDKVEDNYERGLFVEHLFSREDFEKYKKGLPTGNGVFSRVLFKEIDFAQQKKEIKLKGEGEFSSFNLPVSLRKNYIMNSNGFTVQYILKNEGPIAIKGNFVVESNFAQTDFTKADSNSYKMEAISNDTSQIFEELSKVVNLKNVSYAQITDFSNNVSFVFEPNEFANFSVRPLVFKRPDSTGETTKIFGTTLAVSFFWDVDLACGMEMEKTINFSIITPCRRRSSKSN